MRYFYDSQLYLPVNASVPRPEAMYTAFYSFQVAARLMEREVVIIPKKTFGGAYECLYYNSAKKKFLYLTDFLYAYAQHRVSFRGQGEEVEFVQSDIIHPMFKVVSQASHTEIVQIRPQHLNFTIARPPGETELQSFNLDRLIRNMKFSPQAYKAWSNFCVLTQQFFEHNSGQYLLAQTLMNQASNIADKPGISFDDNNMIHFNTGIDKNSLSVLINEYKKRIASGLLQQNDE